MKKSIGILTLFISSALLSCAQSTPAKVTESFQVKFPTAKSVKWEMENDKEWEAEFKMDGKEYSANFDLDGTWMETEWEIKKSELPEMVKATLKNDFKGFEIEEIDMCEKPNFKGYAVELENDDQTFDVVFDENGKVISKKEITDNEKD